MQLCGDAHVLNFGLWATPERNLSFDLRDFDETLPGTVRVGRARLGGEPGRGGPRQRLPSARATRRSRPRSRRTGTRMAHYASAPQLEIWYDSIYVDQLLDYFEGKRRKRVVEAHREAGASAAPTGARSRSSPSDRRRPAPHHRGSAEAHPLRRPAPARGRRTRCSGRYAATLQDDRRHCLDDFPYVDTARQVVGVGSVGMRVHLLLLEGRGGGDPLFLQVKQAGPSVLRGAPPPQPLPQPRRPGGQRQAAHPERDRHLRRLDVVRGAWTSTSASSAT